MDRFYELRGVKTIDDAGQLRDSEQFHEELPGAGAQVCSRDILLPGGHVDRQLSRQYPPHPIRRPLWLLAIWICGNVRTPRESEC